MALIVKGFRGCPSCYFFEKNKFGMFCFREYLFDGSIHFHTSQTLIFGNCEHYLPTEVPDVENLVDEGQPEEAP